MSDGIMRGCVIISPGGFFSLNDMPISMPHVIRQGPLVTLVSSRFFSLGKWLLEAFFHKHLAYFSKRNRESLLFEYCMEFSCTTLILFPLFNNKSIKFLSQKLSSELIVVENGMHLNGSAGWFSLPQCMEELKKMMK